MSRVKKGVVLAGGKGTRLLPFTKVTNKHLLPVSNMPMIEWPIRLLLKHDIKDILIITGTEHAGDIFGYLGSGSAFDANFTYRVQDEANGIAGAIKLAKDFVGNDEFITILGDNITWWDDDGRLSVHKAADWMGLSSPLLDDSACRVFLKSVDDPHRFGVAKFEEGELVELQEKPKNPPSDLAVMGIYHFRPDVFGIINQLVASDRGELEVTDAITTYLRLGMKVQHTIYKGFWSDAGTHESYKYVNQEANKLK